MIEERPNFRLAVYGASNAAGFTGESMTDYNISEIVDTAFRRPNFVSETPEEIVIDLSENPQLEEGTFATNCSDPGATAAELLDEFDFLVLEKEPTHVFIWSGLNDIGSCMPSLHSDFPNIDESAEYIMSSITGMVLLARRNGIIPIIGTIPPYAALLAEAEHDPKYPDAPKLLSEGRILIDSVNNRIRNLGPETSVIDAYEAVLDPKTGLTRAELCYGDWLHLNTFGQISVATLLCTELLDKPVRVIPPDRARIKHS